MSAITAKASRKMKKYAVLTREPRCFLGSFDFSWEQREVGDLLIERSQQAPMSDEYPLMAFIANEGVAPKGERYDRSALVTDTVNKLYKKTEKGDFIYSSNNLETGSIGLNKYGKSCISPVYSIFEPTGIADSDFLGRRLVRKDFINAMVKWRQGVIYGQWRIHESDFLKIEISVPSVEEQRKIGAYLDQLDNLITLHQRKCISFTVRAGRLISTVNKKRITSSWEQRKLGEVIRLNGRIGFRGYTEKDIVTKDDGGVLTFSPTNIVDNKLTTNCKNTYITRFKYDESPEIKIHNGDILFVKTGSTLGKSALVTGLSEDATLNPQVVVMRTNNLNVEFLAAMLVTNAIISQVNSAKIGGAIPTLTETRIKDFDVAIPVSEAEKEQIGQFFSQLDHLITLHQRKPFLMKWRTSDANRNQTNRLVL